jgi:hypothetical protein
LYFLARDKTPAMASQMEAGGNIKVFCFFSSEKKTFLLSVPQQPLPCHAQAEGGGGNYRPVLRDDGVQAEPVCFR